MTRTPSAPPDHPNHPPAHPEAVLEAFQHLMFLFRHRLRGEAPQDGQGEALLAPMEARALGFFARHPGASQSELVQHSGRDKAQVARLIKGLIERGLLQREADAADRRSHHLTLTPTGQAAHRQWHTHRQALSQQLIAGLDSAQLSQLATLLAHMNGNLEREASTPPPGLRLTP